MCLFSVASLKSYTPVDKVENFTHNILTSKKYIIKWYVLYIIWSYNKKYDIYISD